VKLKLSPIADVLRGKRVIVVDDSIVRGTTSRKIVRMVREAGATEVHFRISSPPWRWPCYYGIDTPTRGELIASQSTPEEINRYITSDSLEYLTMDNMVGAIDKLANENRKRAQLPMLQPGEERYCHACFSGNYPIEFKPSTRSQQMRLLDL